MDVDDIGIAIEGINDEIVVGGYDWVWGMGYEGKWIVWLDGEDICEIVVNGKGVTWFVDNITDFVVGKGKEAFWIW